MYNPVAAECEPRRIIKNRDTLYIPMERSMKVKALTAAIALTLVSGVAAAESYQAEVSLDYLSLDGDATILGLGGEYYFSAVETDGKPLGEAAFLNKSSGVYAQYVDFDGDASATAIGVEYYIPDSIFYVGANYVMPSEGDNDWGVTLGLTPVAGWLVTTEYSNATDYELNLQSKYVTQLSGDTAINFEASYADGGDGGDDAIGLGLDYYFNHNFSAGVFVEDSFETAYGVRTEYFFSPSFSAEASFSTQDAGDTFGLGITGRF